MELWGYFGAMMIGVSLGLLGGGGAILAVPLFVYFFSVPPTVATTYSLFVVGLSSLVGFFQSFRQGQVDLKAGLLFAAPSFAGVVFVRCLLLPLLPQQWIWAGFVFDKDIVVLASFAIVMLSAASAMILPRSSKGQSLGPFGFALRAFVIGGVTGFVGAGGGFLIVPVLVSLLSLSMRVAVGTSLGIIAVNSLLAFFGDVWGGVPLDGRLLFITSLAALAGIFFGSSARGFIPEQKLKSGFGVFVFILGCFIFIQLWR